MTRWRTPCSSVHALDLDDAAAGAARSSRPSRCSISMTSDDLRLRRGVDQRRVALGQDGGEDEVHRAGDAGVVEEDARAAQALGPSGCAPDTARLAASTLRAERPEAVEVHVERSRADARRRRASSRPPRRSAQQRPHDQEAGALVDDQLVRRVEAVDLGGADAPDAAALVRDLGAQGLRGCRAITRTSSMSGTFSRMHSSPVSRQAASA